MLSRDLEVRALRLESVRLLAQAENVLNDLRVHQGNLERFLIDFREVRDETQRKEHGSDGN